MNIFFMWISKSTNYLKRAGTLTLGARCWFHFVVLSLRKGPQNIRTFVTIIFHNRKLRQYASLQGETEML